MSEKLCIVSLIDHTLAGAAIAAFVALLFRRPALALFINALAMAGWEAWQFIEDHGDTVSLSDATYGCFG